MGQPGWIPVVTVWREPCTVQQTKALAAALKAGALAPGQPFLEDISQEQWPWQQLDTAAFISPFFSFARPFFGVLCADSGFHCDLRVQKSTVCLPYQPSALALGTECPASCTFPTRSPNMHSYDPTTQEALKLYSNPDGSVGIGTLSLGDSRSLGVEFAPDQGAVSSSLRNETGALEKMSTASGWGIQTPQLSQAYPLS